MGAIWAAFLARFVRVQNFFPAALHDGWHIFYTRARAQGAARSHRLVLVKRIRFIARLYKLEALVGITHHSGVTTAGKNRGSEKERDAEPHLKHTRTRWIATAPFFCERRANCLNTHLLLQRETRHYSSTRHTIELLPADGAGMKFFSGSRADSFLPWVGPKSC